MNFKNFDLKNNLFIRNKPVYKEAKKERILIGSGNSLTYTEEIIRKTNIASKYFIPNICTPINPKNLGQVRHNLSKTFKFSERLERILGGVR